MEILHYRSDTFLLQIGSQHMKTSQTIAWKCGNFAHVFLMTQLKEYRDTILQIQTSCTQTLESTKLSQAQEPFSQVHHHRKTWGIVRWG